MFVSPFEHHSNLLPWREIGAEAGDQFLYAYAHPNLCCILSFVQFMHYFQMIWIGQDESGLADIRDLEDKLKVDIL